MKNKKMINISFNIEYSKKINTSEGFEVIEDEVDDSFLIDYEDIIFEMGVEFFNNISVESAIEQFIAGDYNHNDPLFFELGNFFNNEIEKYFDSYISEGEFVNIENIDYEVSLMD